MKPLISLCIIHWNTPKALVTLLSSLNAHKTDRYEIIVIDNASTKPIQSILDRFPNVKAIINSQNFGYAHACNQAASASVGEWLLFLNPDVDINQDQVELLLKYALEHNFQALSPIPKVRGYALPLPSPIRFCIEYSPLKIFRPLLQLLPVKRTLTGGCLLIKRQILFNIGGWDERFFLWFEDSDLTARLYQNRYLFGWCPIIVHHRGGTSVRQLSDQTQKDIFFHSAKAYAKKHFSFVGQLTTSLLFKKFSHRKTLPILSDQVCLTVPNLKKELLINFFDQNWPILARDIQLRQLELIIVSSSVDKDYLWQLRQQYPLVRFVSIKENLGFASTVNIGFRASAGIWLGTVNDDVVLSPRWLEKLLSAASGQTGSINPVIKNPQGKIESAGINILDQGKAQPITQINKQPLIVAHSSSNSQTSVVDATNGACVLYRKQALDQVGLFDEKFGSYLEDIDLSLRLKRVNWQNMVNHQVTVVHQQQASSQTLGWRKNWLDAKNWWLVIFKNWTLHQWLKNWPSILLERGRNLSGLFKALPKTNRISLLFMLLIGTCYVFLRLYKIDTSLLFFNDIGRDFLSLFNWFKTGKPPLLGPQTSALPYNQSAVYFYLLAPLFLLTKQSFFSTIYTVIIFYLAWFVLGIKKLWSKPIFFTSFLITSLLICIHPLQIIQNRFVWNPSFVAPLLVASYYAWQMLVNRWSKTSLAVFSLSITLAVSLNYSVAPVLLAFLFLSCWRFREKLRFMQMILATGISMIIWNLPTLFFELRHGFLLTNLLIHGEKLPQTAIGFNQKMASLSQFLLVAIPQPWQTVLLISILLSVIYSLFLLHKKQRGYLISLLWLFGISLAITLIVPIAIQAHYIFGLLVMAILVISLLHPKVIWIPMAILCFSWLRPTVISSYFSSAYRSVNSSNLCAMKICQQIKEPTFVSVQSDLHPYHNGMEWKYLFLRNGCDIKELDTQITEANQMIVVVDNSKYEHGSTAYNELTQFGSSQEVKRIPCQDKLEGVILQRL